jgi:hemerythrin
VPGAVPLRVVRTFANVAAAVESIELSENSDKAHSPLSFRGRSPRNLLLDLIKQIPRYARNDSSFVNDVAYFEKIDSSLALVRHLALAIRRRHGIASATWSPIEKGGRMQWREEYSVGVAEIDDQHRDLVDCIAQLRQSISAKQRWSVVHAVLVRLADYVRIHFAVEESLMRITRYPGIEQHLEEHRWFRASLDDLKRKTLSMNISEDMTAFLADWLGSHIMRSDKRVFQTLRLGVALEQEERLAA